MFDAHRARAPWTAIAFAAVLAALVGGAAWLGDPVERASVLAGGGNPLAEPFVDPRVDQLYPESPLVASLRAEAEFGPVAEAAVTAFADELAREVGFWALASTGTSDLDAAERALWTGRRIDDLAVAWALGMQARELHARERQGRLSAGIPERGPRYLNPEEAALVFAHVAWRLDLDAVLIRSPEHWYVELRDPAGAIAPRGLEPTCFWRVDAAGEVMPSEEPSVGRRLSFPADHYSSGVGGIRNPSPLPAGAYEPISAAALPGALLAALAERYGEEPAALDAAMAADPAIARSVFERHLEAGLAAWAAGDVDEVAAEVKTLAKLRSELGDAVGAAPDERALAAFVAFRGGDSVGGNAHLDRVIRYYEPNGPREKVRSEAHAMALWLDLEFGPAAHRDWNARVVPLLNRYATQPTRLAMLCPLGLRALRGDRALLESRVPSCAGT
ncbi:MAG: hypothetical protein ABMA64_20950 [Myxococcota bacterium]